MKKIIVLTLFSLSLVGCSSGNNNETKPSSTPSSTKTSSSISSKETTSKTKESTSQETSQTKELNETKNTTLTKNQYYSKEVVSTINQQFLNWASERAKIGGMAVTSEFFNHGAAGRGDWYAVTPDGLALAQDLDNPGYDYFPLHVVGGVTFYYSKNGTVGQTTERNKSSFAAGFSEVAYDNKPIVKYILCDNGMIYELQSNISLSSGFSEASDDGEISRSQINEQDFTRSEDKDAIQEYQRIISRVTQ